MDHGKLLQLEEVVKASAPERKGTQWKVAIACGAMLALALALWAGGR